MEGKPVKNKFLYSIRCPIYLTQKIEYILFYKKDTPCNHIITKCIIRLGSPFIKMFNVIINRS